LKEPALLPQPGNQGVEKGALVIEAGDDDILLKVMRKITQNGEEIGGAAALEGPLA